jgi:outer membrane protein assembly factor BamB
MNTRTWRKNTLARRTIRLGIPILAMVAGLPAWAASSSTWPQLGYTAGHSGFNATETVIGANNAATLVDGNTFGTQGAIVDPVVIAGGVAYVNSQDNYLRAFDLATGAVRWSFFSDGSMDAPTGLAVGLGKVFVTCEIDTAEPTNLGLCAVEAATGKQKWSYAETFYNSGSPLSPPAISGDTVYFEEYDGFYNRYVTALNATTGAVLWKFGYCNEQGFCVHLGAYPPAIDGGMVYFGCTGFANGPVTVIGVCAVNATTGQLVWQEQLGDTQWTDGSGRIAAVGGKVYVADVTVTCYTCNYTIDVWVLDGATGTTLWDTPITGVLNGANAPVGPPAVADGKVYQVINAQGPAAGLVALNARTGKILWSTPNNTLESAPTVVQPTAGDAALFTTCSGNGIIGTTCAFDGATGALIWNSPDSGVTSSPTPVVTGGALYNVCGYNVICTYTPGSAVPSSAGNVAAPWSATGRPERR